MKKTANQNAKIVTKDYIRKFFCLSEEEEEELDFIYSKLERITYKNGEDICTIDGEGDGMFFLESGMAAVINREGEQVNVMNEGQYFGEYAVLAQSKRLSTVQSMGRTIVYRLSDKDMQMILANHPNIYGEFMKRVYGQLSQKHTKILEFSRMRRRVIRDKKNLHTLSPAKMCLLYGVTALAILLAVVFSSCFPSVPMFFVPLLMMIVYVLVTRRMVESLLVGSITAAALLFKTKIVGGFADVLLGTVADPGNVSTVAVMAMLGSMVTLICASGSVTAFRKVVEKRVKSKRTAKLSGLGIMAVTAIDEGLCSTCASESIGQACDEQKVPHEENALLFSLAPTVLCSFVPFSVWAIWVIGTINPIADGANFLLYCKAIPYNLFSIVTVVVLLLLCIGKLPRTKQLKAAGERVKQGGKLWPEGSEAYINHDNEETNVWGHIYNLLLPILVLIIATCVSRSISEGAFIADSICGLIVTLVFMFFLYCGQRLMAPEKFMEHAAEGMRSSMEAIVLYLLSMNFFALLEMLGIVEQYDSLVNLVEPLAKLIPAILFIVSMFATMIIGTSWSMFAMAFPIAAYLTSITGVNLPLCIGAICAAGIAGEQNCVMTGAETSVAESCGLNPEAALKVRLPYSMAITGICFVLYLIIGFLV